MRIVEPVVQQQPRDDIGLLPPVVAQAEAEDLELGTGGLDLELGRGFGVGADSCGVAASLQAPLVEVQAARAPLLQRSVAPSPPLPPAPQREAKRPRQHFATDVHDQQLISWFEDQATRQNQDAYLTIGKLEENLCVLSERNAALSELLDEACAAAHGRRDAVEEADTVRAELEAERSRAERLQAQLKVCETEALQLLERQNTLESQLASESAELGDATSRVAGLEEIVAKLKEVRRPVEGQSAEVAVTQATELIIGIEAQEDPAFRGVVADGSEDDLPEAVKAFGAHQVFRISRVHLRVAPDCCGVEAKCSVPALAQFSLRNSGSKPWPQATALVDVGIESHFGSPVVPLPAALEPGATVDIELDLRVPGRPEPGSSRAMWAALDVASGRPLGLLLIFDVVWT